MIFRPQRKNGLFSAPTLPPKGYFYLKKITFFPTGAMRLRQ